ncbi:MAG: class I adenylate-forming enzyme family protein [Nitrososphaeria archaeon]
MILDLAKFLAGSYGDNLSFEDYNGEKFSFSDVDRIATSFATELKNYGVKEGDHISLFSDNTSLVVMLLLASIKIRTTLVVHNIRLKNSELLKEVRIAKPSIAIASERLPKESYDFVTDEGLEVLKLEKINRDSVTPFEFGKQDIEDVPLVIFTGGTTGEPKGAKISLRSIIFNSLNTAITWNLSSNDVSLLAYPFYHTGGWNVLTMPLYIVGGRTLVIQKFKPDLIAEILMNRKITVFSTVPAVLLEITQLSNFPSVNFPFLRFIKSGGGMTPPSVMNAFRSKGINIFQGYGLTEAGPNLFYSRSEDSDRPANLGRKTPFCDLKLVDENGKESDQGELEVSGPIIFSGYLESTDVHIKEDSYIKTGDILKRDERGLFYFIGRKKFMYKSGGENVYPSEVESVIESHPSVLECAVIGVPDLKWGEVGKAFVVTKEKITEEELRQFAEKYIAKYKVPKYFSFIDKIPRTATGKKDYYSLLRNERND